MSMSAYFLNNLLPMPSGWVPDERGAFVLSVLPDVVVNIIEDPAAMQIHFLSAVGEAGNDDVVVDGGAEEPGSRGRKRVLVAQETGLVTALRTVESTGLEESGFTEELGAHVAFARVLAAALAPTDALPDDGLPAPVHGVSTWFECEAVG